MLNIQGKKKEKSPLGKCDINSNKKKIFEYPIIIYFSAIFDIYLINKALGIDVNFCNDYSNNSL